MSKRINEAPIDYGTGRERMASDIQKKIEDKDTPLSDNPALDIDIDGDGVISSFEEKIASKRFQDVVNKVKEYTGLTDISGQSSLMQLQRMLAQAVNKVKSIENENVEYLQNLAVDLVKKEMSLPDDAFQFDAKLNTGMGQVDTSKMNKQSSEPEDEDVIKQFGVKSDEAEDDLDDFMAAFETFDMEKAKRRFINSLIQGASKKGHYMFALVEDELNRLDPSLLNLYGVLMSIADLMYWIVPDEVTQMMSGSGEGIQGSEEVDDTTDPPTIKAVGLFFPILIHELLKGVYEVIGTQGLPDDPKSAEMVMASQDTLPYEIWDLRLGPVIWEKFIESYPDDLFEDDLREIQNYLFSRFSSLTTSEFFEVAKEIMKGSEKGKKIVKRMVDEINEELRQYDYEDAMSSSDDEEDNEGFKDFLGGLGIDLS
jgi:hypothetical protein|tara:strand:- start:8839 stop:10116 length:1278 start_codon:yes stop_codon:yes gene_type:complete